MVYSWELLQTRGWWFAVGLILCIFVTVFPLKTAPKPSRTIPFSGTVWGALLPVCNFAAVLPAAALRNRGLDTGTVFAFLSAAVLLNPAGILSAWAYMGPKLAAVWILCAAAVSLAAGAAGRRLSPLEEKKSPKDDRWFRLFSVSVPELAFWMALGTLAQGLLQALMPQELWQGLLGNPAAVSFPEAAAAALMRHVCIPDDVALAASLTATGFPPGWAMLLLTVGISSNLPELFVLYGSAGKKVTMAYALVTVGTSLVAAIAAQMLIGPGFVPQFSLANAEPLISVAGLLTIRTWMPAKIPCAVILLLLAIRGMWNCRRK